MKVFKSYSYYIILCVFVLSIVCAMPVSAMDTEQKRITLWQIDDTIPRHIGTDEVCNLMNATYTQRHELSYQTFADTLTVSTCGDPSRWYKSQGDTITMTLYNDRLNICRFDNGVPCLILNAVPYRYEMTDSAFTSTCGAPTSRIEATATYEAYQSGGFILPDMSRTNKTICVHSSLSDSFAVEDDFRWYVPTSVFPVVEYRRSMSLADGQIWTSTYICPLSEHPENQPVSWKLPDDYDYAPTSNGSDLCTGESTQPIDLMLGTYHIMVTGNLLSVTETPSAMAQQSTEGSTVIRLFDVSGRLWHEEPIPAACSTASLPEGVYIIEIDNGAVSESEKIQIRH